MKIDCIADLHGYKPKLTGGDLLIIAGDLTARDTKEEIDEFDDWLYKQKYKKKIFIAGNHDNNLVGETPKIYKATFTNELSNSIRSFEKFEYLCDSGTEFEGLKIWGSPWSLLFDKINPKCKAFTGTEEDLEKKFDIIPEDVNILITHTPPYGMLDNTVDGVWAGSMSLLHRMLDLKPGKLLLHCFGHIHEARGNFKSTYQDTQYISANCSLVNERYKHVHKPFSIEI
jgi:Icc-related predicted phosphoesterase